MRFPHWHFSGPSRRRDPAPLLKHRDVPGAHVAAVRRVVRIGPWALMIYTYRPGNVDPD